MFQQVRREAVAQHVGSHIARDARAANALFDVQPQRDGGEGRAAFGEEHVCGGAGSDQFGTAGFKVTLQGGHRFASQRYHTLLVAFADDIDETSVEM